MDGLTYGRTVQTDVIRRGQNGDIGELLLRKDESIRMMGYNFLLLFYARSCEKKEKRKEE